MNTALHFGMLAFPGVLQMDLTGPYGVFAACPESRVDIIWKDTAPFTSSDGLIITPTLAMAECPRLDVLCIPGGAGILPLMGDTDILNFIRSQARERCFLASVCTGALVLGAAGLLSGRKATTHWQSIDILAELGAVPVRARVVSEERLITSAGVSAGIDMALTLAGLLFGDAVAETVALQMEYAPDPRYCGDPQCADPELVSRLVEVSRARQADRLLAARAVGL